LRKRAPIRNVGGVLTIRDEQLTTMNADDRARIAEIVLASMPSVFPGDPRVLDRSGAQALVDQAFARAAQYRIHSTREVTLFAFLLHDLGPEFEQRVDLAWMRSILVHDHLAAREKMDVIYARLRRASGAGGANADTRADS
jgi:hypothetical protein